MPTDRAANGGASPSRWLTVVHAIDTQRQSPSLTVSRSTHQQNPRAHGPRSCPVGQTPEPAARWLHPSSHPLPLPPLVIAGSHGAEPCVRSVRDKATAFLCGASGGGEKARNTYLPVPNVCPKRDGVPCDLPATHASPYTEDRPGPGPSTGSPSSKMMCAPQRRGSATAMAGAPLLLLGRGQR